MKLVAVLISLLATAAAAQCKYLTCLCDGPHAWIAKVEATSATAGVVREVFAGQSSDAGAPPSVGMTLSFGGAQANPGDFLLVDDTGGSFPLANGGTTVRCSNVSAAADEWAQSLANGTCGSILTDGGFKQPDCHDTVPCGCSTGSDAALGWILLLRAVWRRR